MSFRLGFSEGPGGNPADLTNVLAVIGYCSALVPTVAPYVPGNTPQVKAIQSPGAVSVGGYGPGPELAHLISRRTGRTVVLVPTTASTAGVLSAVSQTGTGPIVTCTADSGGPWDDGFCTCKVSKGGAPGVAEVQFAWSYQIENGVPVPLYQGAIVMPARAPAEVIGTVDLATLAYATPARTTGTVDLTGLTWGPGGLLDGRTLYLKLEGGARVLVTFAAPASPAAALAFINVAMSATPASLNLQNQLVLSGSVVGAASALALGAPAIVTGSVDLTTLSYPGGLDGKSLAFIPDGGDLVDLAFATPANAAAVVSQINVAAGATVASLDSGHHLMLTGAVLGAAGSINVTGTDALAVLGLTVANTPGINGTALAVLGLTAGPVAGVAGDLDGLTVTLATDLASGQTVTFAGPVPSAPADVISKCSAATGLAADIYSGSRLRLRSNTKGSTGSVTITGGSARTMLGLSLVAAAGAESSVYVPHLGITWTFSPSANGTFRVGTTYGVITTAPKASDADINLQVDAIRAAGLSYGAIVIAQTCDVTASLARAASLDAKMVAEHIARRYKRAVFGTAPSDSDASVKAVFASFRSAWVDRCDRGAYIRTSDRIPGGGSMLRSTAWAAAVADAWIPFHKDRGDRGINYGAGIIGLPDVDGVTVDEGTATTPMVGAVGAAGVSSNVIEQDPDGGWYFSGGYTSADGTSRYCDSSVRNVVLRGAEIYDKALSLYQNTTDLDTDATTKALTQGAADEIDTACETAMNELVPDAAQAVKSQVDTTIPFYDQKRIAGTFIVFNRVPARSVAGTIGPGPIGLGNP